MQDFNEHKEKIKQVLANHLGRSNPISRKELVQKTGIEDRLLRELIVEIIEKEQVPIVSAIEQPSGVFLATTKEEVDYGINILASYLVSLRRRIKGLGVCRDNLFGEQKELCYQTGRENLDKINEVYPFKKGV